MKIAAMSEFIVNSNPVIYSEHSAGKQLEDNQHKFNCRDLNDFTNNFVHNTVNSKPKESHNRFTSSFDVISRMKAESQKLPNAQNISNRESIIFDDCNDQALISKEPCESGRTRSSTRRANQANQGNESKTSKAPSAPVEETSSTRGKKRKKKKLDGDASDSDPDEGNAKSKQCIESIIVQEEPVCSCPKNVMKCIGILPSLPIVSQFYESDDSISSLNDDLSYTVLPTVSRNRREGGGDGC